MEVRLADQMGFCFGVRRAEELIEQTARKHGRMATLGPLVHNRQVAERLEELGVRVVSDLAEVDEQVVAISAHGAPPDAARSAEQRSLHLVDGTCPFVRKAQLAARDLAAAGFAVLVFGDPGHREVKGILGWGGERTQVVATPESLPSRCPGRKIGIVSQTTQNNENFRRLVEAVVARWFADIAELRVVNTICDASVRRQRAAKQLATQVAVMVVIGSKDSANTGRLVEVCRRVGTPTYQVEDVEDLVPDWFSGVTAVGVTAGASTPDWVIERVTKRLREF